MLAIEVVAVKLFRSVELYHQIVGPTAHSVDTRMAEAWPEFSPIKTLAEARCANLHGYPAVKAGIHGAEHLTHAA
jgi:hypothetical protein